jgi:hypothetical protein
VEGGRASGGGLFYRIKARPPTGFNPQAWQIKGLPIHIINSSTILAGICINKTWNINHQYLATPSPRPSGPIILHSAAWRMKEVDFAKSVAVITIAALGIG